MTNARFAPVSILGGFAIALAMMSASISAIDGRLLPRVTVISTGGAPVASDRLSSSDRWLLIYVAPACVSCQRLLRALDGWHLPQVSERVVVVVRGSREAIDTEVSPMLSALQVYEDPEGNLARPLDLTGAPALLGIEHGRIDWSIDGVLNDPAIVEPLARSWLER